MYTESVPAKITHEKLLKNLIHFFIAENKKKTLIRNGVCPVLQNLHYYILTSAHPHVSKKNTQT
jgi:hypothetical protein